MEGHNCAVLKNKLLYDIIIQKLLEDRMIRESIKQAIYTKLNYDIFRFEDFIVSEELDNSRYEINIKKDEYYYIISFDADIDQVCVTCMPGDIFNESTCNIGLNNFVSSIKNDIEMWLKRLKTELLNPVQVRYLDDTMEAFVNDINNRLDGVEDLQFTKEEKTDLLVRLEKLEELLASNIKEDSTRELRIEIAKMQKEIEFLKEVMGNMSKKKWLKNFLLKIHAWGKEPQNQELLKIGMETVKTISQIDFPNAK